WRNGPLVRGDCARLSRDEYAAGQLLLRDSILARTGHNHRGTRRDRASVVYRPIEKTRVGDSGAVAAKAVEVGVVPQQNTVRRSGLEHRHAADLPSSGNAAEQSMLLTEPGQLIAVSKKHAMARVKARESAQRAGGVALARW